jgi:hypothetical protein
MSKIINELELKFSNFEKKIENKINSVQELYANQQCLLNERFNVHSLSRKYTNELKSCRERLLQRNPKMRRKIRFLEINEQNTNAQTDTYKSERAAVSNLNQTIIRSAHFSIIRLIMREFKFGCQFSASQLIKYKHILGISEFLIHHKDNTRNMTRALIQASQNSNLSD